MTEIETTPRDGFAVRVNGVALHVEQRGHGDPILCIHGSGSSAVLWSAALDELAAHGRVIGYDRRGSGRSERPEPYATNVHEHADDAAALIDALDAASAIVIGRSYGGEIAVDLALRYPDRVRALALLEGGGLSLGDAAQHWIAELDKRLYAVAENEVDRVGEEMVRAVVSDEAWESMPEAVQRLFTANGPAIIAEHRGGPLDLRPQQLATIEHPTLLVAGKDSPSAFAETTELLAAALPSPRVAWVDGGHLIDPACPPVLAFVDEVLDRA
jgi:esterase